MGSKGSSRISFPELSALTLDWRTASTSVGSQLHGPMSSFIWSSPCMQTIYPVANFVRGGGSQLKVLSDNQNQQRKLNSTLGFRRAFSRETVMNKETHSTPASSRMGFTPSRRIRHKCERFPRWRARRLPAPTGRCVVVITQEAETLLYRHRGTSQLERAQTIIRFAGGLWRCKSNQKGYKW